MRKGKFLSLLMAVVMAASVMPMSLISTAAEDSPVKIYALKFRAHPKTYSIFDDDQDVPDNMLWAEFSNSTDNPATYHQESRTYELNGKYYQIEISRPPHGPEESQHPEASIVPENDVHGKVKDEYSNQTSHIYHGWQIGQAEGDLFVQDATTEYQVGDYKATLNELQTEEQPQSFEATQSMDKTPISYKELTIVEITYTLSSDDKGKGYKLKCPNEQESKEEITELVAVGDLTGVVNPKLDGTSVHDDTQKTIVGWKVVKNEAGDQLSDPIGNYIPPDDNKDNPNMRDDKPNDHKIKLQAILDEPKSYAYEITKDENEGENIFPAEPSTSPAPVSYNQLVSSSEEPKTIEYEPEATIEPLTLRLVNKGNQPSYIYVKSDNDVFTVQKINKNTGTQARKHLYEGGLDAFESVFWYIPSDKEVKAQNDKSDGETWVNYAEIKITPKKGLPVGHHKGVINVINRSESVLGKLYEVEIDVSKREVRIAPKDVTKPYGKELTDADILCDVYDSSGEKILASDKKASELGVPTSFSKNIIQSDGMRKDAKVGGGTSDGKYVYKSLAEVNSANYDIKLKENLETGITVTKETPKFESVVAKGMYKGSKLSTSTLSGRYTNPNSGETVEGSFAWEDGEEVINTDGTIDKQYQFTPNDLNNYELPAKNTAQVVVSNLEPTNLKASSLEKTYNGLPQTPNFSWDRPGVLDRTYLKVTYKKVEDGDTTFREDEDFTTGYDVYAPKEAGTYKVHATYPGSNPDSSAVRKYAEGVVNAIMTINPRTLELNLSKSVKDKMYDGTKTAEIDPAKVTFKNKALSTDDVKVKASAFTATFDSASFDPYYPKIVKVIVSGTDALEGEKAANYRLNDEELHATGYISQQRPIKLALKDTIKKSYGAAHTFTANDYQAAADQPANGGLVDGDDMEDVHAVITAMKGDINGASAEAPVGDYDVKASALAISGYNYAVTTDSLGKLTVEKATPKEEGEITAENGKAGNTLNSVKLDGKFINPNNAAMSVDGDLEWEAPNTTLTEGRNSYNWKFTPTDSNNYNPTSGSVYVTAGDKEPAQITLTVPEDVIYDGQSHPASATSTVSGADITIEYAKTDIELHDATLSELSWTPVQPVNAGTYQVRATVKATEEYASNTEEKVMTILQAAPEGSVTAGNVDKGAHLTDSVLTHDFKDINGEPLEGLLAWDTQGVSSPNDVIVTADAEYTWIFAPAEDGEGNCNYKTVTGTTQVEFNVDTRKAEAEIYNLPKDYDGIGDYAYVNVDGKNLKVGDTVQFYADESNPNPESNAFVITDDMDGWTLVNLDDDALKTDGGKLYLNIKGSSVATEVQYKAEVGFKVSPTQVYMRESEKHGLAINKSDESYEVISSTWTPDRDGIVTVAKMQDSNTNVALTGKAEGNTVITVTAEFAHPDPRKSDKTVSVTNYATVTVSKEEPPEYTYTTKDATNITQTGATLNGHIDIEVPEGSAITPSAVGMFLLWEKTAGEESATRYGADNHIVLNESGDYSITIDGLKPGTTYAYKAIGIDSDVVTPGDPVEFTTEAEPVPTPTAAPTVAPTVNPGEPTPTAAPTSAPTSAPTDNPTSAPTSAPTNNPTSAPTNAPTDNPTSAPTTAPTGDPTVPTSAPTNAPDKPTPAPVEDVEIIEEFEGKLTVEQSVENDKVVFDIEVKENIPKLQNIQLFEAEYDDEGRLIGLKAGVKAAAENGHITIKTELPDPDAAEYKYMLWADDNDPIIKAITKIQ